MRLWRRARGWVLVVAAALVGGGIGIVAGLVVSDQAVGVVVGVVGAVAGVVAARGKTLLDKGFDRRDELPARVAHGRLVRVREADDPILLGVHPADDDDGRVPVHVPRDVDRELDDAVRRGGFVLVRGESTAGKSRASYESVRRLLPDHVLFAPTDGDSVRTIVDVVLEQRRCVVWLDDIERFLGPDRLTAATVNRMVAAGALVLATIRLGELDRFGARWESEQDSAQREGWRVAREVLRLATEVTVSRRWSEPDLARARQADDRRIRTALPMTGTFGLAELLANGPELVGDWEAAWEPGRHPRGAALVAAAVDCRRAGLHEPVPFDLLDRLAEHYLGGPEQRPEPLDEALRWATTPARGASSLLIPIGDSYLAFDYLVDVPTEVVPHPVWTDLVEWASPEQAMRIGLAAKRFARFDVVGTALGKAVHANVPDADIELADGIGRSGRPKEAVERLTAALAARQLGPDTLRIRGLLARYTSDAGQPEVAADMFVDLIDDSRKLLGPDHPDTLEIRRQAAIQIGQNSDRKQAASLLAELAVDQERLTGPEHPKTFSARHLHAIWLGRSGNRSGARELFGELLAQRIPVQGPDHPGVLSTRFQIAVWTSNDGRSAEAVRLFDTLLADSIRVLGENHPHTVATRYRLGLSARDSGDLDRARAELTTVHEAWTHRFGRGHQGARRVHKLLAELD